MIRRPGLCSLRAIPTPLRAIIDAEWSQPGELHHCK